MNNLLPRKQQRVELQRALRPDRRFPTYVEEVRFPLVLVAPPMEQEHLVPLVEGEQVELHYFDGRGDLTLVGVVRERPRRRGTPVALEVLEVTRVQRRRFFRWQGDYPVRFLAGEEAGEPREPGAWRTATTADISAGGLSLRWDEELPPDTPVSLELFLGGETVRAQGRVVRSWPNTGGGAGRFLVGIEFTHISEGNQARIMRFIFSQEVQRRRR